MWKSWLAGDPFVDTRGAGFFYTTPALNERLSRLRALLEGGEGAVVLVGGHGSGKTTLVDRALREIDGRWRSHRVDAGAAGPGADVERILPAGSAPAETDTVLVVDDADRLAPEALHSLIARCGAAGARKVALVLCGTPRLLRALSGLRPVAGAGFHAVDLPALNERQVGDYIHRRLRRAGHAGDDPFTDEVVHWITSLSRGLPGRVNVLAREVMAGAGLPGTRAHAPGWVAPAAVAAAVVTGVAVGYRSPSSGAGRGPERTVVELPLPAPAGARFAPSGGSAGQTGERGHAGTERGGNEGRVVRRARDATRLLLLLRMTLGRGKRP